MSQGADAMPPASIQDRLPIDRTLQQLVESLAQGRGLGDSRATDQQLIFAMSRDSNVWQPPLFHAVHLAATTRRVAHSKSDIQAEYSSTAEVFQRATDEDGQDAGSIPDMAAETTCRHAAKRVSCGKASQLS